MVDFKVSVIIPVFNAADFVTKAVVSALIQPEVSEILLIEDGSKDTSLKVCKQLANKYEKVKLFTHLNNKNKGAGISRNVGIVKSSYDFIAFLDADDYYLPNRFRAETKMFLLNKELDGVYGALGFHYYSSEGKTKYIKEGYTNQTTLSGQVVYDELFLVLLGVHEYVSGIFSLDTLTLRKRIFEDKTELFCSLPLHQDFIFNVQLSLNCRLEAGIINEAVGMRGVHDNNRIVNRKQNSNSRLLRWRYLYNWSRRKEKNKKLNFLFRLYICKEKIQISDRISGFFWLTFYCVTNPFFFKYPHFFNSSCLHVFGVKYAWYIINMKNKIQKKLFHVSINELDWRKNFTTEIRNS